ncbi:MAG: ATP-dependent Clp protease proteolytic subunit [Oscillospiraceae bacterium]|nr:ATP-dependent Clp protease proteolytic subunit [Oscillospiraceae bacterium]
MILQNENTQENDKGLENILTQKLLDARCIMISGGVDQKLAQKISTQLLLLSELGDGPIKLFINSQGGHVEAGDTIHDMIRFVKPDVYVIGTGWVASAGVNIFLAVDTPYRFSLPNTRYMIHQPSGGVQGVSVDIAIEAKEILKIRERINRLISRQTGQPLERVQKDTERNFWMSAKEAVEYGIVGRVISSQAELDSVIKK